MQNRYCILIMLAVLTKPCAVEIHTFADQTSEVNIRFDIMKPLIENLNEMLTDFIGINNGNTPVTRLKEM